MKCCSARQRVGSLLSDPQEHDQLEGQMYAEQKMSPESFREKFPCIYGTDCRELKYMTFELSCDNLVVCFRV